MKPALFLGGTGLHIFFTLTETRNDNSRWYPLPYHILVRCLKISQVTLVVAGGSGTPEALNWVWGNGFVKVSQIPGNGCPPVRSTAKPR